MFGFLKNKKNVTQNINFKLLAPVSGKSIPLAEVPDPVFAQKMVGDGLAINPTGDTIVAPCDGKLTLILDTKHAFAMTLENGVEILVHIGLDTVSLNGEGFEKLIEQGTNVKAGTPIIKVNADLIKEKGFSLISIVLITNPEILTSMKAVENIDTIAGETTILEYTI